MAHLYIAFNKNDNTEIARYQGYGGVPVERVLGVNNHDLDSIGGLHIVMSLGHHESDYALDGLGGFTVSPTANADAMGRQADRALADPVIQSVIEMMWESLPGGSRPTDAIAMTATAKQKLITKLGG